MRYWQNIHFPNKERDRHYSILIKTLTNGLRFRFIILIRLNIHFKIIQTKLPDLLISGQMPSFIHCTFQNITK